jgi:hypothetical protein
MKRVNVALKSGVAKCFDLSLPILPSVAIKTAIYAVLT